MTILQLLQKLHSLKLEFLLPLPLILIVFGVSGESLTNSLLSRSYHVIDKLQANTQTIKVQIAANVKLTTTAIQQEKKITTVELLTRNSPLKKLTFKVPATDLNYVKAMIAQELKVAQDVVTLQADTELPIQIKLQILGILAEIEKERSVTTVEVKTTNSILKHLEFEFPVTELNTLKTMITKELGIDRENARLLVSYRVKN